MRAYLKYQWWITLICLLAFGVSSISQAGPQWPEDLGDFRDGSSHAVLTINTINAQPLLTVAGEKNRSANPDNLVPAFQSKHLISFYTASFLFNSLESDKHSSLTDSSVFLIRAPPSHLA